MNKGIYTQAAGGLQATVTAKNADLSPADRALDRASEAIGGLEEALQTLEGRLSAILGQRSPEPDRPARDNEGSSTVVARIHHLENRALHMLFSVRSMVQDLEV